MIQVLNFSYCFGKIRLPKYSLYEKQAKTETTPARYMWVDDPRTALRQHFIVNFYDLTTNKVRSAYLDSSVSSIAKSFHDYALSGAVQLCSPIANLTNKEIAACGPHDRYVPEPKQHGTYTHPYKVSNPVTEGCRVGHVRVNQEGYNYLKLKIKVTL